MILPNFVQSDMTELRRSPGVIDYGHGGQLRQEEPERIPFRGALLPLSTDDLRAAPQGTYTAMSRKLYTEHSMAAGTQIEAAGQVYTVTGVMDYGSIHPLKRYTVEHKGAATA